MHILGMRSGTSLLLVCQLLLVAALYNMLKNCMYTCIHMTSWGPELAIMVNFKESTYTLIIITSYIIDHQW